MGKLRFEPKEEKLEFVVLKSEETFSLSGRGKHQKKVRSSIRVTCGSFSIEVSNGFDARLLDEVLRVVGGCQC